LRALDKEGEAEGEGVGKTDSQDDCGDWEGIGEVKNVEQAGRGEREDEDEDEYGRGEREVECVVSIFDRGDEE
jgi:hypothetical protein